MESVKKGRGSISLPLDYRVLQHSAPGELPDSAAAAAHMYARNGWNQELNRGDRIHEDPSDCSAKWQRTRISFYHAAQRSRGRAAASR